jgi:outer membrane protein TolC
MNTTSLFPALALSLAAVFTAQAQDSSTTATPAFIERLVNEAVTTHPKAQAAQERANAARAAIGMVRLWQDPQAGLGFMAARQSMRQDDGDIVAGVEQMLPRAGLYKAEKRKAEAEHLAQGAGVQLTSNELGLSVAQAALELALADELIALQAENIRWLETIVRTAEERAKNPDASGTETLRLQGELAAKQQTLGVAQRQRTQFARALNVMLGRGAETPWQFLSLPTSTSPLPGIATLQARMERLNPQLTAMRHMADSAQAETDAARQRKKPVFSVGVETSSYSGGDLRSTMFMVRMSLPWFNRSAYQADIAKAEQSRLAAQSDLAAQQRELVTQLSALVTEAENNQQLVDGYTKDVLPRMEKAVETLQNAWISSKATLLDVLDARRALLDARQEQKRALAARHVAIHGLSAITGTLAKPSAK